MQTDGIIITCFPFVCVENSLHVFQANINFTCILTLFPWNTETIPSSVRATSMRYLTSLALSPIPRLCLNCQHSPQRLTNYRLNLSEAMAGAMPDIQSRMSHAWNHQPGRRHLLLRRYSFPSNFFEVGVNAPTWLEPALTQLKNELRTELLERLKMKSQEPLRTYATKPRVCSYPLKTFGINTGGTWCKPYVHPPPRGDCVSQVLFSFYLRHWFLILKTFNMSAPDGLNLPFHSVSFRDGTDPVDQVW